MSQADLAIRNAQVVDGTPAFKGDVAIEGSKIALRWYVMGPESQERAANDTIHANPEIVARILDHPLIHIGASDAGAHVSQFCGAGDTSDLFERFVRQFGKTSLELAVHRLTGEPADAWGMKGRGKIAVGAGADLILFDANAIARGEEVFVSDFPGEARRYIRHARGIESVIVNGEVVRDANDDTKARAGQIV